MRGKSNSIACRVCVCVCQCFASIVVCISLMSEFRVIFVRIYRSLKSVYVACLCVVLDLVCMCYCVVVFVSPFGLCSFVRSFVCNVFAFDLGVRGQSMKMTLVEFEVKSLFH